MSIRLAWHRQEKNPWQLAAKYIDFPWHSTLGRLCLAAGRQEHLPWRFSYIPWRISTAKVNLVSGSDQKSIFLHHQVVLIHHWLQKWTSSVLLHRGPPSVTVAAFSVMGRSQSASLLGAFVSTMTIFLTRCLLLQLKDPALLAQPHMVELISDFLHN